MTEDVRKRLEERGQKLTRMRKDYTLRFYQEGAEARSRNKPMAHLGALGPTELLYSMGFQLTMPENYVTICCAKQMAGPFCETAEERGFSRDICSYSRCGLGMLYQENGPYGAMPKPDLVVGSTGLCDPYVKWWETWAKEYDVPFYLLDMPFNFTGELQEHELEWMASSLKGLAAFVEEHKLGKFNYDKFQEAVALSARAMDSFWEVYELKKAIPCPRGLREIAGDLFYSVSSLGRPEAAEYYSLLAEDTRERVRYKIGALPEEKFRIFYDNIPVWYRLQLIDYLSERGAVIPMDSYIGLIWLASYFDGRRMDPEKPWESVALRIWSCVHNFGPEANLKRCAKIVQDWHCDGAIFFSNSSCISVTGVVTDKAQYLKEEFGTPSMAFQAEMADPRSLAEAQVTAQMDVFLEVLEQRKG